MTGGFFLQSEAGRRQNSFAQLDVGSSVLGDVTGLGDITGAAVRSARTGPGSSSQDLEAFRLSREFGLDSPGAIQSGIAFLAGEPRERQGRVLSKEEFEQSEFADSGIKFQEGMTDVAAQIMVERRQRQAREQTILNSRDDLFSGGASVLGALVGSVTDVKAIASEVAVVGAAGLATGGIGAVAAGAGSLANRVRKTQQAIDVLKNSAQTTAVGRTAVSAAPTLGVSTAATVPMALTGRQNAVITDEQYTTADAVLDLAAAGVLSVGFQQIGRGISNLYTRKVGVDEKADLKKLQDAQVEAGQIIDTNPIAEMQLLRTNPEFSTINFNIDTPRVRKNKGGFIAEFQNETGMMQGVRAVGTTRAEAIQNLRSRYSNTEEAAEIVGLDADVVELLQRASIIQQTALRGSENDFNRVRSVSEDLGLPVKKLDEAQARREANQERVEAAQQKLDAAPDSPSAKKELVNAQKAAKRSEDKLDQLLEGQFAPARTRIREQQEAAGREVGGLRKQARDFALARSANKVSKFIERQAIDPSDVRVRSLVADPDIRNADFDSRNAEARQAPPPGESVPDVSGANARARSRLEEIINSDQTDPELRSQLQEALEQIDRQRQRPEAFRALKGCLREGR